MKKTRYIQELENKKKEIEKTLEKEKSIKVKKGKKLQLYEFNQNNSGGGFTVDKKLCHRVVIEAYSFEEAREKAKDLGIYFDGVSLGLDCSCCGDRWSDYSDEPIGLKGWENVEVHLYPDRDKEDKDIEKKWYHIYGKYEVVQKPKWVKKTFKCFEGKIKLNTMDEYFQFIADEYGHTTPDIRVYYYDGKVKEFFQKKKKY